MTPEQLERTTEISEAIESLCLGSVTHAVIEGAVTALLDNWDGHNDALRSWRQGTSSVCALTTELVPEPAPWVTVATTKNIVNKE